MVGITSYGFYVPRYRIKTEEIANRWGKKGTDISGSLGINEKAVASFDEDALTMAYEASDMALEHIDRKSIEGIFVGSETHPYLVNPTSTILGEYLGIGNAYQAFDTQFACKAATGALITGVGLVKSEMIKNHVLVVGTDKASGKPGDPLDYSAASAAAAVTIGSRNVILEYIDSFSYSSDIPDFWRRHGQSYPSHGGRFTGYFSHISGAVQGLLSKTGYKPSDFARAIFHMPNGKYPVKIASSLGFNHDQIKDSLVVTQLGNSYAACVLVGLSAVIDTVKKDDLILIASYGSGAGSDAIVFKATNKITSQRKHFNSYIKEKKYIDYTTYLKFMGL